MNPAILKRTLPTYDKPDRQIILMGCDGNLAVLNDLDEYVITVPCRITKVHGTVRSTGATSGNTTFDVKKSAGGVGAFTSILTAALSIPFNAAAGAKYATSWGNANKPQDGKGLTPSVKEPSGVECQPGDVLRLDVTAIPGTTSAGLSVYLEAVNTQV